MGCLRCPSVEGEERAGSDLPLRAAALDGIGNSGDPSALDAIAPYVDSASEITRAAAVTALRQMDDARAAALLARRFAVEPDAPVRTSIVQALAGDVTRPPPPHAVDLAIRALPQEADRAVRAALIVLLGEAAATHPGARAALAAQYPREREATERGERDGGEGGAGVTKEVHGLPAVPFSRGRGASGRCRRGSTTRWWG